MPILLTRDDFREAVFRRDRCKCVMCQAPAVDAHHIVDRDLWGTTGGYYLDNGASLCSEDHLKAETTETSVEAIRAAASIRTALLPEQFEDGERIDKWGNPVLPNGQRMRGEMFSRENVQRALAMGGKLALFTRYVKYPRTPHAPGSPGGTKDDMRLRDLSMFAGRRVRGTVKMDGENTSLYGDHYHARSVDGRHHPSRDWAKRFWSQVRHDIPEGWRVVCENLYARHSIAYDDLPSYLLGLSVWDDRNVCLSTGETDEYMDLLGIASPEVLYEGPFDEAVVRELSMPPGQEGSVWRLCDPFTFAEFRRSIAKFVREEHVKTDKHWMHGPVVANGLAERSRPAP